MIDKNAIRYTAAALVLSAALLWGCSGKEPGLSGDGPASESAVAAAGAKETPVADNNEAAADSEDTIVIDYPDEENKEMTGTSDEDNTTLSDNAELTENTAGEVTTLEEEFIPETNLSANTGFSYTEVPESVKTRMRGLSYPADDSAAQISWDQLRYLKVLYVNYSGITCEGELVCNKAIADDLIDIFRQLYAANYQICQIRLVDDYMADDDLSIAADNTSCFNYRVVEGTTKLSNHGLGRAIDINPLFNPCVYVKSGRVSPPAGAAYADRSVAFPHKIDKNDLAYKLFTAHGFTWGGDWKSLKDYQHFEKK